MAKQQPKGSSPLDQIAGYVKKNMRLVKTVSPHHHGVEASIREADYKDHHIVIRTTYEITVDGKALRGHMGVDNAGQVHYHPVPNASFASAVDLVKNLIDTFPDDFKQRSKTGGAAHHEHDDSMPGMAGTKKARRK